MDEILRFLADNEIWIYAVLGIVGLLGMRKLLHAWGEWRGALFGLEREAAQRRFSAALAIVILTLLFASVEFIVVSFVTPNFPGTQPLATPTLDLLSTPIATLDVAATIEPTVEGGPTLAPITESGCEPGVIEWTYPNDQEEISGVVEPSGTVNVPNLGFYKYEYSLISSDSWTTIAAGNQPKIAATLGGNWNTAEMLPGDYRLRLVVTDNQGGVFPACEISVRIIGQ